MAGHATVAGAPGCEAMHPAADAAAEHFAQCPWLGEFAHQRIEMKLCRLTIDGANTKVRRLDPMFDFSLARSIEQVADNCHDFQVGPALLHPTSGQVDLG